MKVAEIKKVLSDPKTAKRYGSSARSRAKLQYAKELLDTLDGDIELNSENAVKKLLNGSENWYLYSYDGNSLIYDEDIAKRVCTPSQLKRKDYGRLAPNSEQTWLEVQAHLLQCASWIIIDIINGNRLHH